MATTAAERQRLYAERQRNGLIVVPVVCVELDVIAVLQAEGFMDQDEPTRAQLSDALSKWVYREMTRKGQKLYDVI